MKIRYAVVNAAPSTMEGDIVVEGESVFVRRNVFRVDLVPEDAANNSTVTLALHGNEIPEAKTWRVGDVIEADFKRV